MMWLSLACLGLKRCDWEGHENDTLIVQGLTLGAGKCFFETEKAHCELSGLA